MGCGASVKVETAVSDTFVESDTVPVCSQQTDAGKLEGRLLRRAQERLIQLADLDASTKVPFILVELTGEGNEKGEIEVCGKDEYGIYESLDHFFQEQWRCEKLEHGDEGDTREDAKIPFCAAQYRWPGYLVTAEEGGLNNMGLMAMRLIDFMCSQMSWTLAVVNGGNVGKEGEVREFQVIFKAPHPMNLVAPHLMLEIRSAGYIQVSADLEPKDEEILETLDGVFKTTFKAKRLKGHDEYCDRYYKVGRGIFQGSSGGGDSNLGLLTTIVCDEIVKLNGWNLVACDTGNYGERSQHEEQRLIYRRDMHPFSDASYLFITLSNSGTVEVAGRNTKGIFSELHTWLTDNWNCQKSPWDERQGDSQCCRYTWTQGEDILVKSGEVIAKMDMLGWELQLTSQGAIKLETGDQSREQQLVFRAEVTDVGAVLPQIFVQMYAGEGKEELYEDEEEPTQVTANQYIRLAPILGEPGTEAFVRTREALDKLKTFIEVRMDGTEAAEENKYNCNVFLCRGRYENNMAQWTMRLCDFMVDQLAWSFLVCSLCSTGEYGQYRSQQMVFRWENDHRDVPVTAFRFSTLDTSQWIDDTFPDYWKIPEVLDRTEIQKVIPCDDEECAGLQTMVDVTFRRILTRDRQPDDDAPEGVEMPYRLQVLHAFRSEHAWLHHGLMDREREAREAELPLPPDSDDEDLGAQVAPKTAKAECVLNSRLAQGEGYLFHGTNPSSAMSILKTGFVLDHAGKNVGAMYGYGIYTAECSSKADEYARDDGGNTYPSLMALLVCRCFIGKAHVVYEASPPDNPATDIAKNSGLDCVVGDREAKVGTYREFIFFDERAVYPEICVIYRRVYSTKDVPSSMVVQTSGTTGRFWQIRGSDKKWSNLPTELNKMLIQAKACGNHELIIRFRGEQHVFNLEEKKVTTIRTGWMMPIRPPYVS